MNDLKSMALGKLMGYIMPVEGVARCESTIFMVWS